MRRSSRPASTPATTEPFSATNAVSPRPPQSRATATPPTPAWAGRRASGLAVVAHEVELVGRPAHPEVVAAVVGDQQRRGARDEGQPERPAQALGLDAQVAPVALEGHDRARGLVATGQRVLLGPDAQVQA